MFFNIKNSSNVTIMTVLGVICQAKLWVSLSKKKNLEFTKILFVFYCSFFKLLSTVDQ